MGTHKNKIREALLALEEAFRESGATFLKVELGQGQYVPAGKHAAETISYTGMITMGGFEASSTQNWSAAQVEHPDGPYSPKQTPVEAAWGKLTEKVKTSADRVNALNNALL